MPKINVHYLVLNQPSRYNWYIKNERDRFQVLRLATTTDRPKIGEANRIVEANLPEQVDQAEQNLPYFYLNQAFFYNESLNNKRKKFQVLGLLGTTGRPKIGEASRIVVATC